MATPQERIDLLNRKKELLLEKQRILSGKPEEAERPGFLEATGEEALEGAGKTFEGVVDIAKSLDPRAMRDPERPFTSRAVLKTAAGLGKIVESPIAGAFAAFEPEIQQGVEALFKDVDEETKKSIGEGFEKIPDPIKSFFVDVIEATGLLGVGGLLRVGKEGGEKVIKEAGEEIGETVTKQEARQLKELGLETVTGKIGDVEVQIPKPEKRIAETVTGPLRTKDTKVLAGRALAPRTIGKSAKQKLASVADVENRARSFHNNVRLGVLKGDISTIENAAQSVVDNIDTVGERIGNAVKKVEGNVSIKPESLTSVESALKAKGAGVSPATSILKRFQDDVAGQLTIEEAFDLKKLYSNEVSKLYKSGDSGTKQFKALSDGVKDLNSQIDDIIENQLGKEFAKDKQLFRSLKLIVDDITASALVEGRRAPNTLAEQIGMIEGILSPKDSIKRVFVNEIGELNTRGGAWKELVKLLDDEAIQAAK